MRALCAFVLLYLCACGHEPAPDLGPAGAPVRTYEDAADRTLTFLDGTGMVITRHEGGQEKHQGDALIFTGLLVASLDCARGERPAQAIFDMPPEFWRHRTLAGQQVSLDGALGAYQAIAYRIKKCGEAERWRPFLAAHAAVENGPDVPPYFDHVRDRLFEEVGVSFTSKKSVAHGPEFIDGRDVSGLSNQGKLEVEVGYWARSVVLAKAACYRINLGLMAFETLELLGDEVGGGEFCAATKTADLPTVDKWCGRDGLDHYLAGYRENAWQYRHQRCPDWEDEDGGGDDGNDQQPGVDYLRAWAVCG